MARQPCCTRPTHCQRRLPARDALVSCSKGSRGLDRPRARQRIRGGDRRWHARADRERYRKRARGETRTRSCAGTLGSPRLCVLRRGRSYSDRRPRRRDSGDAKATSMSAQPAGGSAIALRRVLYALLPGVVVYGAFAVWHGIDSLGSELARFHWWAFAAACGLALANYGIRWLKWEFYLSRLEIRGVRRIDSLLTFLSGFVLTVTPGKVGEVFKSVVLFETYGVPVARTAPIVVAARVTDVIGVVVLIVGGSLGFSGGLVWAARGSAAVLTLLVVVSNR